MLAKEGSNTNGSDEAQVEARVAVAGTEATVQELVMDAVRGPTMLTRSGFRAMPHTILSVAANSKTIAITETQCRLVVKESSHI